ncbi:MbtH family protein [Burkholderia cepacia]|uniref:MbtH family protein n=1 Tax=Burkholderia cepacia TaxID=292 RepID=UPI002AB772F8|nr:MbtH family NRPS accessory protein [Burkholderia cepacia]
MTNQTSTSLFKVVVNEEGQYSIWPADRHLPEGWIAHGEASPREQCLSQIDSIWLDMRPKSLRVKTESN